MNCEESYQLNGLLTKIRICLTMYKCVFKCLLYCIVIEGV